MGEREDVGVSREDEVEGCGEKTVVGWGSFMALRGVDDETLKGLVCVTAVGITAVLVFRWEGL